MQITLNVSGADLSKEVNGIMEAMSVDEKKEFAKSIMMTWLKEPVDFERQVREAQVMQETRVKMSENSGTYNRRTPESYTDKEVRESYQYRERLKDWKSTKEIMIEGIIQQTLKFYQELATKLVQEDPQTLKIWEEVKKMIVAQYPEYVRSATISFFATHMFELKTGIDMALRTSDNFQWKMNEIRDAIGLPQNT